MLKLSVGLYLLAGLGVVAMGLKYIRATPLIDYHDEIMRDEDPGEPTLRVLGALYKVMGGGFLALGLVLCVLAIFGVGGGHLWASFAILMGALIAGGFAALVPREVERATGVRTPWRIGAGLTLLTCIAFVLSVV